MAKPTVDPADYVLPLNINGLIGRMLRLPAPKGRQNEIMFVYGHHSSLERIFGVAEYFNRYGGVTIPDLPGFGGMDPFYKIGQKPTLDNMADYLATFIKFRYKKDKKFTIIGLSLGFTIITRMLQMHPELTKQINSVVSFAGLTNKSDFKYRRRVYWTFRYLTAFLSHRIPAGFLKYFVFRGPFIRLGYAVFEPLFIDKKNTKVRTDDEQERKKRIDFEVHLWQCNDIRTYMYTGHTMFTLELAGKHVDHKVHHLAIAADRYFDNTLVEQHMREIYRDFQALHGRVPAHSPSVIATAKEAAPFVKPFARLLRSL